MNRLLFILILSVGSIIFGYVVQLVLTRQDLAKDGQLRTISRFLKLACFFFLNPIAVLSTFWGMRLPARSVLAFPFLGLLSVLIGAAGAFLAIRLLRVPPKQAGSVFTCCVFSNVVTFGGLIVFTLFREPGYALMQLFTMFMSPTYYLIGYPVSSNIARGDKHVFRLSSKNLKENPYLLIPATAIAAGLVMRFTGLARPDFFGELIAVLVPVVTGALGIAIGLTLALSRIRDYPREIAIVLLIRHVALPLIMIPIALAIGFHQVADGMPFKTIIILSAMPVAFNALVPPAIYGFDLDLANSAWIVSTAALVPLVPLFFFLFA